MRIISGIAGRRKIAVPASVARPSMDRLREALFSMLGQYVPGARVLDLFAGSGSLGLEALSRGAVSAVFVDASREAQRVIGKNLRDLGFDGGRVVRAEVSRFLKSDVGSYDIVFADPPYFKSSGDDDHVAALLGDPRLLEILADDALLIVEDDPQNSRGDVDGLELIEQRQYGNCGILIYQRGQSS